MLWLGCVIGGDSYPRPRDLSPSWLVDRPRVLAVVAEPPEIAPGETAVFSALVPVPPDEPTHARVWFACPDNGLGYGCPVDLGTGSTTGALPEGLIGLEPGLPPTYTAPVDALSGLDEIAAAEGVYTLIEVISAPEDLLLGEPVETLDFEAFEVAFKRLIVSDGTTPNHNPGIAGFTVEGVPVETGALVHLDKDQPYELGVTLQDDAVERYSYINTSGVTEDRIEEPYVTWYADDGEMLETYTLYPFLEAGWVSPARSGAAGTWWAVVRDRRGGMAWIAVDWIVS